MIADNCAKFADQIFNHANTNSGSTLALGAFFFTIQIYCDFSGYSDIALGTARLFGIELFRNFAFPYFSRDIAEFWRRWHISLSSWFKDYVYIPLGGSRGGTWPKVRNTFIIFLISGFWHGANWTFLVWGFLNALYILPSILSGANRNHLNVVAKGKLFPSVRESFSMAFTFFLSLNAWVFFRSKNVAFAFEYLLKMYSKSLFSIPYFLRIGTSYPLLVAILLFFGIEWLGREQSYALERFGLGWNKFWRWSFYFGLILAMVFFQEEDQQFIYFQF